MNNTETSPAINAFNTFAMTFSNIPDLFHVHNSLHWLRELGKAYGVDMDAVEAALRSSNAKEVASRLHADPVPERTVRIYGEMGFNLSQLASCVYDRSTGLDIVEPLGDTLGFLLVLEALEKLYADTRD